jgi:hypothetical protein
MRTKIFKSDYIYNLGKNMSGQRVYMTGEEIVNRYTTSIGIGLNKQQSGKLRKIARQILNKEKGQD